MASLRICLPLALGMALVGCPPAPASPAFHASKIEGPGQEIFFGDLDGDHLKDAVLVDGRDFWIFYQDAKEGFTRKPQQQYRLEDRPALVWPARLGAGAESVLVMTSEGVDELAFTNRTAPPARRQLIGQRTILPEEADKPEAKYFPLTANTRGDWPLLLVPVTGGLQVWRHDEQWRQAQFVEHAVDTRIHPSVANPGYTVTSGLSLTLADINGDGRDDLMVMRRIPGGMQVYALYPQQEGGLFAPRPSLLYTNREDWRAALAWVDLNRDGRPDLIKCTFLNEPSFIPLFPSGKVLVSLYLADQQGRLPAEPQQVFRKHDWSPSLPLVDVDGDGYVDLVLGNIPINTREGSRKAIAAEQVDLGLKLFFNRPGAGFPQAPDCQRDVVIRFHHQFFFDLNLRRLYYDQFVSLNGDFNGDGRKDLLVRDRGGEISVYFFRSREKGFSPEADLRFNCPESIDWWEVTDLNGDGASDLVVKLWGQDAFRVFISEGK